MAKIQLTLSPHYVNSWGTLEGLRELMQNCIDRSHESPDSGIILNYDPMNERLKIGNLLNLVTDDEAGILSEIMAEDLDLHEDVFEDHLNQCIVNLKIMKIKNYCKFLEQEIKKAQDICDDTKVNVLFKELNEIKKKEVEI